jgi:hypothetical protein
MATPRFERPVYFLRSRAGEVLGPFSLAEIDAQLTADKLTNDGEMRRQGWEVLEKEELWGKVKDFRTKGHGGPTGRAEVYELKAKAMRVWIVGVAFFVITLGAFIGLFFLPYDEAGTKMKHAQDMQQKAKDDLTNFRSKVDAELAVSRKQWTDEFDSSLKKWQGDLTRVSSDLGKATAKLRDTEEKLAVATTNISGLEGKLKAALADGAEAKRAKDVAVSELSRTEKEYRKKFESMDASFESRVSRAESNLKQEFAALVERQKSASKGELLQALTNPQMARVLPSTNQGQGRLVLLVAQRPPVGTRLELFDGSKSLRVTVPPQMLGPPLMVVDVDPGQSDSASSLGFLGLEVLMQPGR